MARTLKTNPFGAGTTPNFCLAVDDDGTTLKDFASSAVTADMTRDAGTSITSTTYRGKTLYGVTTTSTAFVNFGTNKPTWSLGTGGDTTLVVIANPNGAAGSSRILFGATSSDCVALAAGPRWTWVSSSTLNSTVLATGATLRTYAVVADEASNPGCFVFAGDGSNNMADVTDNRTSVSAKSVSLSYVGRRNDSTSSPFEATTYLIVQIPADITASGTSLTNLQAIHDDPYGTLFDGGASAAVSKLALLGVG